jgi:hypothetical protein
MSLESSEIQPGTPLSNSSIGLTPVEFMYRTEKSQMLLDSLYPDCWKPMIENEMQLMFELCGTKEQKAACCSSSGYIKFSDLQGPRATKLMKFLQVE